MKNERNRLLAAILVFVMVSINCIYVQGASETVASSEAVFDSVNNTVTISGIHPLGDGARVSVEVRIGDSTFYKREVSAGAGGAFSISYKMDVGTEEAEVDKSGVYVVLIGGAGLTAVEKQYPFISKKSGKAIVDDADGAKTALQMKTVLETHSAALNIDLSDGGSFGALSEEGQTAVYAALATENNFGTANNIINMFEAAVAIQTLNEASASQAEILIERYKNILGFNLDSDSDFAKIQKNESKNRLYAAMVGGKLPPADKTAVVNAFESAVYTQLFNEITTGTRDKFMTYVSRCNAAGYSSFSLSDYNSSRISDKDRADIIISVISEAEKTPFSSLADVETAFEKAAADKVKETEGETGTKKPSGGGGGGRVVVQNIDTAEPPGRAETGANGSESQYVFSDLMETAWAAEAINYLAAKNIVNGVGDGKFNPKGAVKREEFVKMLMLTLKVPSEDTEKRFHDVAEDAWYYSYVKDAYALNIVTGTDFDIFGVGQSISREQMCTMLYRAMKFMDINIEDNEKDMLFKDRDEISEYALEAVEALYRAGIINGVSPERLDPKGTATRAMVSQMLCNIAKRGNLS